jgi:endoglucanase
MDRSILDTNTGTALVSLSAFSTALLVSISLATAILPSSAVYSANSQSFQLGIYDPEKIFSSAPDLSLEHIFVHWQKFSRVEYRALVQYAAVRNRQLMVTVEPWTRAQNWTDGGEKILGDVVNQSFDAEIEVICKEIGATPGSVLVRWGHEMDDDSGRYPWANKQPGAYIAAYRHFVDLCRSFAPEARYVWSPQAKQVVAPYYPGDNYVDLIGLSFYALQRWDLDHPEKALNPNKAFEWLYARVKQFNKPIIIAEFGVSGDQSYKQRWLRSILQWNKTFEKLRGIVYFNSLETGWWPPPYGAPDWRITPDDLRQILLENADTSVGGMPKYPSDLRE